MAEIVRLDRPHNRYSDLELHFRIAQAVDKRDAAAWVQEMTRLRDRGWLLDHDGPIRVPAAFYDRLCVYAGPAARPGDVLTCYDSLAVFGREIVPVED